MIIGVDTSFLLYFFAPPGMVGTPLDDNGVPVTFAKERVTGLLDELEKVGAKIVVGTPALSELMIRSGVEAAQAWATIMRKSAVFKIVPFDEKSAVEVAIMAGHAVKGESSNGDGDGTYAKLKYDRQIVAIAHTEGATVFYSDDRRQRNLATRLGMAVRGLADCIVPAAASQTSFAFGSGRDDAK